MQLKTYPHQVTGHTPLLTTEDNSTIGKPVDKNELLFYKTLDPGLLPFVAEFKGVGYVTMETNNHGNECYSVVSSEFDLHRLENENTNSQRSTEDIFYRGLNENEYYNQRDGFTPNKYVTGKRSPPPSQSMGHTPWAGELKQLRRELFKADEKPTHFIFLGNISKHFSHPCILDFKLGTRIHGDICTKQKRENHIRKSAITTTSKVGLRLCGSQVFQNGQYSCRDKLYGRGLSVEGLERVIYQFFTSDSGLRIDIVKLAVEKLTQLEAVLEQLESYRFFGSALLLVRDGKPKNIMTNQDSSVEVKLVDFCRSTHGDMAGQHEIKHVGPDRGALFGITNLIKMLSKLQNKYE